MVYYKLICKYCEKLIEGISQSQVAYNHWTHEHACYRKLVKKKTKKTTITQPQQQEQPQQVESDAPDVEWLKKMQDQ